MEVNMQSEVEAGLFAAAAVEGEAKKKGCTNCGASGHNAHYREIWKCPQRPREDARYSNHKKLVESWEAQQQATRDAAAIPVPPLGPDTLRTLAAIKLAQSDVPLDRGADRRRRN